MIRRVSEAELGETWAVVNDGAQAYRGIVPADRLADPYMSEEELRAEIAAGVHFWGQVEDGRLVGVMRVQRVADVTLIRHAYVRSSWQSRGIGARLLQFLRERTAGPMLLGTWAASLRAIRFYEREGFRLVSEEEKNRLLRRYWRIPERQVETSVVLAGYGLGEYQEMGPGEEVGA